MYVIKLHFWKYLEIILKSLEAEEGGYYKWWFLSGEEITEYTIN
jgi:hypothetical protein